MSNRLFREYDSKGNLIKRECRKCHEIKSIEYFHKDSHIKDGYKHICKECACVERRLYRKNNLEKERNRDRNYIKEHRIERREYMVGYYMDEVKNAMIEIYENVTKKLYPNNGIQYGIIYAIHCIPSDRWYIGQTIKSFNLRYREGFFKNTLHRLSNDNNKGKLLKSDIQKYGQENFEIFEVLDLAFSEKELDEKEAYYIDLYKAYDEGYNSNRGYIFKHCKTKMEC